MTYTFTLHPDTEAELKQYQEQLVLDRLQAGRYLKQALADVSDQALQQLALDEFIERFINTKHPQIFAEMSISGDGSDNFSEETDFIGYEQSGLGLDEPYVVSGLFGSNVTQHRWWQGHTHLWRDDPDSDSYGDAGGVAEQYSIVYNDENDGGARGRRE